MNEGSSDERIVVCSNVLVLFVFVCVKTDIPKKFRANTSLGDGIWAKLNSHVAIFVFFVKVKSQTTFGHSVFWEDRIRSVPTQAREQGARNKE